MANVMIAATRAASATLDTVTHTADAVTATVSSVSNMAQAAADWSHDFRLINQLTLEEQRQEKILAAKLRAKERVQSSTIESAKRLLELENELNDDKKLKAIYDRLTDTTAPQLSVAAE